MTYKYKAYIQKIDASGDINCLVEFSPEYVTEKNYSIPLNFTNNRLAKLLLLNRDVVIEFDCYLEPIDIILTTGDSVKHIIHYLK